MSARPILVTDLGRRGYGEVLELQRRLCRARQSGELAEDLLLLVEHEPVVTLGRGTKDTSLPIPPDTIRQRGVEVFEVERGGDVTFHGPGQLVGYPILDLTQHRPDLHWYLRAVEEALIDALDTLGIPAERRAGLTGVWTRGRKIASIGIHVKQWVTFHGFALNVSTDLSFFDLIVPCGIDGVRMTSVARELGAGAAADPMERTRDAVTAAFGRVFERAPRPAAEREWNLPALSGVEEASLP
ncbi:MAG TPA: lipoyl(octanoyl) transferase LipB [Gemmatimonadales bacterium]|nr:lipoyl(octanoyl) transferase LipB [Gemmatimonadales bacterium]